MNHCFAAHTPPRVLSPFHGGGIAYLNDPDSYAGWSLYTPGRAAQARQVEGQRSEKVAAQLLFLYFSISYYSAIISPFPCFTRPYVTYLR